MSSINLSSKRRASLLDCVLPQAPKQGYLAKNKTKLKVKAVELIQQRAMDNAEEIMHFLEVFTKRKSKSIPPELNDYLSYVARTGDPVFQWGLVKCLFKEKLLSVLSDFHENSPGIDIPPYPNVDPFNYDSMKNSLLERLDTFLAAPFTLQRICELLINPRKQYNRIDKFMRAIEKNILVVSTREPGLQCMEQENGEPANTIHNGSDNNSEYNVDVEMEETSWKVSRRSSFGAQPSSSDHHKSDDDDIEPDRKSPVSGIESQDNQIDGYEAVTPPDDSAVEENDIQESDSTEEDKADDSSSSSDEVIPKPLDTEISKDLKENSCGNPKIVEDAEMTDQTNKSDGICEINSDANKENDKLGNNQAIQHPNDDTKTQISPLETGDAAPLNDKCKEENIREDSPPNVSNVSNKFQEHNQNNDEAIVEKSELQGNLTFKKHKESQDNKDKKEEMDIINRKPDEIINATASDSTATNDIDCNSKDIKTPELQGGAAPCDDAPNIKTNVSTVPANKEDDKNLAEEVKNLTEEVKNPSEDGMKNIAENDKNLEEDNKVLAENVKTLKNDQSSEVDEPHIDKPQEKFETPL